jgi:hypothetical protein
MAAWAGAGATLHQQAVLKNLRAETRVDRFRSAFLRVLDSELSSTTPASLEEFRTIWRRLRAALLPAAFFALPFATPHPAFSGDAVSLVSASTLVNRGYVSSAVAAALRAGKLPRRVRLADRLGRPTPLGRPTKSDPPGRPMVWLTAANSFAPLKAADAFLDTLGMPHGSAEPWFAVRIPAGSCRGLAIPTALDALPPFGPAPAGSVTGMTIGLGGTGAPELIIAPEGLPDDQRAGWIGTTTTATTEDAFVREWLKRP